MGRPGVAASIETGTQQAPATSDVCLDQSMAPGNGAATSELVSSQAVLTNGALKGCPDVIDAVRQEQIKGEPEKHHHTHHATLAERIAHEHDALRAAGRESAQALVTPAVLNAVVAGTLATGARQQGEILSEHILSFLSTSSKKNKGVVTDDAELAEFMRQHPELSQYIKELQDARDQALRNAQSKQDSLQSKDNLLAKLDVIATLLEGSPLAPALRMGDMEVKEKVIKAVEKELGEEAAPLAEYIWDRAQVEGIERAITEGRQVAVQSARALADPESLIAADPAQAREDRAAFERQIRERFGPDSAAAAHVLAAVQVQEDMERARAISEKVWQLEVRARVLEGRLGAEASRRDIEEYLASQQDFLSRNPQLGAALDTHRRDARAEGQQLRQRCDYAVREIFRAVDGWGTYEDVLLNNLQGRSQYELSIIRDRYQEMYGEHLRDRLESELSGDDLRQIMRAYHGDGQNQGRTPRALGDDALQRYFAPVDVSRVAEVVLSGTEAQQVALRAHEIVQTSDAPAVELQQLLQSASVSAVDLAQAQAELGLPETVKILSQRATLETQGGQPTLATQRDQIGIEIVQAALAGTEVSDELRAQYAALHAAEYGRQRGVLDAQPRPDQEQAARLDAAHARFQTLNADLYTRYPGLQQQTDATVQQYQLHARQVAVEHHVGELGERIGLLYGDGTDAVVRKRQDLQRTLSEYLERQQDLLVLSPDILNRVHAARDAGIEQGITRMEAVRKAVTQLESGMSGWGTAEARCYAALQGRTGDELRLIKSLYRERYGETLEQAVEGDFSDAELDKMHALLSLDQIGVAAADAKLALNGFWGVDHEALRATLRSLSSTEERQDFKARFDQLYAQDISLYQGEEKPPLQAQTFEEALTFRMAGDKLIAAQSLFEGNFHKADAAIVHDDLDGFWGPRGEEPAIRLEAMRRPDGHLDTERINAVSAEYEKLYRTTLAAEARGIDGAEGRWLESLVEGNEVDAAVHKLRHAMGGRLDGTNESMVREPFTIPAELRAQVLAEDRQGQRSAETQLALEDWAEFRSQVIRRYSEPGMYPGRDLIVDLRDELNDHHFRMAKTLVNGGMLSRADLIADACYGAGTDERTLREETADLTKAEAEALAEEFQRSGYGDLRRVLISDLSGDDEFDILENIRGRPETTHEMLAAAERRARHEDSGILSVVVWGGQREEMFNDLKRLREAAAGQGDAYEIDALYRRFGVSAGAYRDQKNEVSDVIVNTGTVVIMVGGTAIMVVGSGGTATPGAAAMWATYLAGATGTAAVSGVWRATSKWAIRGDGYGNEELAVDGAIMLVDMAGGVAISKLRVGTAVAGRLEQMVGEALAARGGVALADNGATLTGEQLYRYLVQNSTTLRVVVGATQGSVDGAIFAPIQASGITAMQERTWEDGFGDGLLRIGEAGIQAVPTGLIAGGISGGAIALRAPLHIRNGQPVSMDKVAEMHSSGRISDAGRELLIQREAAKGFVTRGDVADALLAGTALNQARSQELIKGMRDGDFGNVSEGEIRLYENKIQTQGSLTRLDEAIITGVNPNRYVATISQREIERRIVATQQEVNALQVQSHAPGLSQSQLETLRVKLELAEGRLSGLQDTLQYVNVGRQAGTANQGAPGTPHPELAESPQARPSETSEPAPAQRQNREPEIQMTDELRQQQEFVSRLERDLARQPENSKIREVIEESLNAQRVRLQDMMADARAAGQRPAPDADTAGGSSGSGSGDDANPWAYDPSESFARDLEANARGGDYYEPLSSGGHTEGPRRGLPPSGGEGGLQLQAAPQRQRVRVAVLEPEPMVRPAPQEEMGVTLSAAEEAVVREMLGSTVVTRPAAAPAPKPAAAPSIEEILAPQFTDPIVQPMTMPAPAVSPTATPALQLSRIINPKIRTMTNTSADTELSPAYDRDLSRAQPQIAPKTHLEETTARRVATRPGQREGSAEAARAQDLEKKKQQEKVAIEEKKRKLEMAKSEPKGGGKLKFSKVTDALGEDNIIVETEERGEH